MALTNYKNYFIYADFIQKEIPIRILVPTDIDISNINDHIDAINAILKDGIETYEVHHMKVTISWGGDVECDLFIVDYWFNLFMWSMILKNGDKIEPRHIFWDHELKRKSIKNYIDRYVLTKSNKIRLGNEFLNNNLCDGLWNFASIEQFSYYLANTINNEDNIALMNANEEFYHLLHISLDGVPFDQVKNAGMEATNRAISIIKDSEKYIGYEHGLANSFRASEAINPRQYKEATLNIGTKPNGSGNIYPYIINKSFSNGGVNDPLSLFIESSTARTAQILSKTNVGDSGNLARLLQLNNIDTILNPDMQYECMSQNYIKINVKTEKHLSMLKNRYFRFNPNGMDHLVEPTDRSLIGQDIYLHSPMTCASHAVGHGICKKCYGDLYYTNYDINAGDIAAEILSSQLTQILLSAKHLLETKIAVIKWNQEFNDFFDIDINAISLTEFGDEVDLKKFTLVIDPASISLVNEEEDAISSVDDDSDDAPITSGDDEDTGAYNEYITHFFIRTPEGDEITFESETQDPLYLSQDLNNIIRKKATPEGDMVNIPLSAVQDTILFYIKINNNEISKTMNDIIGTINKAEVTESLTKDQVLQNLIDLIVDGGLTIDSVHLETILSNQIVSPTDILHKPNWNSPNVQYKMITLNKALTNNPSVIISLLYKDLNRVLYNPLTFTKNAPSFFDLFFHEQPQNYMDDSLLTDDIPIRMPEKKIRMIKHISKEENSEGNNK